MLRRNFFTSFLVSIGILAYPNKEAISNTRKTKQIFIFRHKNKKRIEVSVQTRIDGKIKKVFALHTDLPWNSSEKEIIEAINYILLKVELR